jgi:hypothetical protein
MQNNLVNVLKTLIHKNDNNVKHVIVVFFIYNITYICFFPSCNDVQYMPQSSTLFNNIIFDNKFIISHGYKFIYLLQP